MTGPERNRSSGKEFKLKPIEVLDQIVALSFSSALCPQFENDCNVPNILLNQSERFT